MTLKKAKTKILILHSSSDLYGASKILLTTILSLKLNNYPVYLVLSEEGPLADVVRNEGIEVHIIRLGILRRKYFSLSGLINRLIVLRKAKKKLSALIHENNITTIYSNTTAILIGALLAKKHRIKHVWHVHEIITKPNYFVSIIGKILNKYSDEVIVVSAAVKDHWKDYVSETKINIVHNGIDYRPYLSNNGNIRSELDLYSDNIVIGMIGRVNLWKGQKYFLQIASILSRKYPNIRFVMAGDAYPGYEYLYEENNKLITSLGLSNVVFDLGYRNDIPDILNSLDIFVLPSILPDPFPTVILEGMASRKPVVATIHGGATEMLDHQSGVLIPFDDPEKAAIMFDKLILDSNYRAYIGSNARNRVLKHFSLSSYETRILPIICN